MSQIYIINSERYLDRSWKQPENFLFAATDVICPIGWHELPLACMGGPIGFAHDDEKGYYPVVIQGFESGRNLYVSATGKWLGRYVPEAYRYYPFSIAKTDNEDSMLCINEDSGLVGSAGEGEPFYTEDRTANPKLQSVMKSLAIHVANAELGVKLSTKLSEFGLLTEWPIKIQLESRAVAVEGLFRIAEEKIKELPADQLAELRDSNLLGPIYCQLLSMNHVQFLAQALKNNSSNNTAEIAFNSLQEGDTLNFDNL